MAFVCSRSECRQSSCIVENAQRICELISFRLLRRTGYFTSLLSFIDVLTGHPAPYKTVQAQAQVDSIVLRLSMEAFVPVFTNSPELLMRVVQMVMANLQQNVLEMTILTNLYSLTVWMVFLLRVAVMGKALNWKGVWLLQA